MLNRQIRAREIERIGKELSQTENNKFRDTQFNKFYSDKWKPKYTKKAQSYYERERERERNKQCRMSG